MAAGSVIDESELLGRTPARPSGAWMVRHAWSMRSDPLRFLVETADELGDIVEFPIPGQPTFFVNDPTAVQRVLRDNHRAYDKRTVQYDTLSLLTGQGLLTADFEQWRESRRIQQPAFHHSALAPLADTVVSAADRLLGRWDRVPAGALVDVDGAMMQSALEVVGAALFSTDLESSARSLVDAVLVALAEVVSRAQNPLAVPLGIPSPGNRRLAASIDVIKHSVTELINVRRAATVTGDDLLGLLVGSALTDEQIRDEVVTTLVAGHETVASALTWAWVLLSGAPLITAWLCEEVDEVLGGGPAGRAPSWADYPALTRSRAVVDETLRLYPPAWVITRRAVEDDVLAGVPVPAGALIIISTFALHRHRGAWPVPERFDPVRFTTGRLGTEQRQSYIPFGAGPRLCIGRDFALVEATLMLARITQRYVLRCEATPQPHALVTIRPRGGLRMRLERRP